MWSPVAINSSTSLSITSIIVSCMPKHNDTIRLVLKWMISVYALKKAPTYMSRSESISLAYFARSSSFCLTKSYNLSIHPWMKDFIEFQTLLTRPKILSFHPSSLALSSSFSKSSSSLISLKQAFSSFSPFLISSSIISWVFCFSISISSWIVLNSFVAFWCSSSTCFLYVLSTDLNSSLNFLFVVSCCFLSSESNLQIVMTSFCSAFSMSDSFCLM